MGSPALAGAEGTRLQDEPSQCSTNPAARFVPLDAKPPAAHALLAEVADTPVSSAAAPAGSGSGTRRHALPFQWRITGIWRGLPVRSASPRAHALPGELAATACSQVSAGAPAGTRLHLVPFQCTMRGVPC